MSDSRSDLSGMIFNPDDDNTDSTNTSRLARLARTGIPYHTLPEDVATPTYADAPWQIVLEPVDLMVQPLGLTIHADVILGASSAESSALDVNLASWQGRERGVSRRHLALKPSADSLLAEDLNSTNGSHLDGNPLAPNTPQPVTDGALLALGLLMLRVLFVQQPGDG